jgi:hypothetical protein
MSHKKVLFASHIASFSKFNRPFICQFLEQSHSIRLTSMSEKNRQDDYNIGVFCREV